MEETGVLFRSTRQPILTFMELQPPANRQAEVRKATQPWLFRGFFRGFFQPGPMAPSRYAIKTASAPMPYQASHNDGRAMCLVRFEEKSLELRCDKNYRIEERD